MNGSRQKGKIGVTLINSRKTGKVNNKQIKHFFYNSTEFNVLQIFKSAFHFCMPGIRIYFCKYHLILEFYILDLCRFVHLNLVL